MYWAVHGLMVLRIDAKMWWRMVWKWHYSILKEASLCVFTYIKVVSHPYPSLVPRPSSSVEGGSGDKTNPYPWWFLRPQFHNLFSLRWIGLAELCTQCQTRLQWTVNCCFWTPLMQASGSLGKLEMTGCILLVVWVYTSGSLGKLEMTGCILLVVLENWKWLGVYMGRNVVCLAFFSGKYSSLLM